MSDFQLLSFRDNIPLAARSVASTLFFDSHAWMATAIQKDRESGRKDHAAEANSHVNSHVLNIATVSAGFAIELIYKALALAEGGPIVKTHEIAKLHNAISSMETKRTIVTFLKEIGWRNAKDWFDFMDENVGHSTRRYWNYDPDKGHSGINFTTGIPIMTIPSMAKIHMRLSDLARQRIWHNWESAPLIDLEREKDSGPVLEPVHGVSRGPHIATMDIPAGLAEEGRVLGGIEISASTGEVSITPPETVEEWEWRKQNPKE